MKPSVMWTLIGIVTVWVAVLLTSIFAPDMVSGSQQEHLKIAAMLNWLWGLLTTMVLLRMLRQHMNGPSGSWLAVGLTTVGIWVIVVLASLLIPEMETGSDPTLLPLAAIIAPIAGMLLTRFFAEFVFDMETTTS